MVFFDMRIKRVCDTKSKVYIYYQKERRNNKKYTFYPRYQKNATFPVIYKFRQTGVHTTSRKSAQKKIEGCKFLDLTNINAFPFIRISGCV